MSRSGLLRGGAVLSLTALLTALLGLVRSKLLAATTGPSGLGALAQMNQIGTLATNVVGLGLGMITVKLLAQAEARADEAEARRLAAIVMSVPLLLSLLLYAVALVLRVPLAGLLLGDRTLVRELLIALAAVPLNGLIVSASAVLLGQGRSSTLAGVSLLGAVLGTIVTAALLVVDARALGPWTVLATSLGPVLALAVVRPQVLARLRLRLHLDRALASTMVGPAAGLWTYLLVLYGADTVVRAAVLHSLGPAQNGLYQPASLFRLQLMTPLLAGVVLMLTPALTGHLAVGDRRSARADLTLAWRATNVVGVLAALAFISLGNVYVQLVFSSAFLPATLLVVLQAPAEVVIAGVVVLNAALLPLGRTTAYVVGNLAPPLTQLALSLLLLPRFGLRALAVGMVAGAAVGLLRPPGGPARQRLPAGRPPLAAPGRLPARRRRVRRRDRARPSRPGGRRGPRRCVGAAVHHCGGAVGPRARGPPPAPARPVPTGPDARSALHVVAAP